MRIENKILKAVDKYIVDHEIAKDAEPKTGKGMDRAIECLTKANAGSEIQLIILGIIEREG